MTKFRNILAGAGALVLALGVMPQAASANDGAAFLGGLAVGVVGSAIVNGNNNNYYDNGYGYRPNGFYAQPVYQRRHCWTVVEPVYGAYGQLVGQRRVRECE